MEMQKSTEEKKFEKKFGQPNEDGSREGLDF